MFVEFPSPHGPAQVNVSQIQFILANGKNQSRVLFEGKELIVDLPPEAIRRQANEALLRPHLRD